ncbi:hypothetical protein PCANC_06268 [Puccinia coronata f. sp. avenae]|uniref:DNA topoisomerase (ATP-hydrolyzing) n=1 Tax=Puccinia coronata f. sp. avenae TaxID=200324 RepID=A0A2N5VRJ7_9BASI|nr:hypothetical protein PCANC_06268 [Puccinia coronata f. sp. avenae]
MSDTDDGHSNVEPIDCWRLEQKKSQINNGQSKPMLMDGSSPRSGMEDFMDGDDDVMQEMEHSEPFPFSDDQDCTSDFDDQLIDENSCSLESSRDDAATSDFVELSEDEFVSIQSSDDEEEDAFGSLDEDPNETLQKIEAFVLDILQQINRSGKYQTLRESYLLSAFYKNSPQACYTQKFPKSSRCRSSASGSVELARILCVLELSQDLILGDMVVTKRDAFYRDVNLFKRQGAVDRLVDDLAATLNLTREKLHIIASPRGVFQGDLELDTVADNSISGHGPPMHIPAAGSIKDLRPGHDIQFVLIVEKEAIFHLLVDMNFSNDPCLGHSVLICGLGYPDIATRRLTCQLSEHQDIIKRHVPMFILVDCDPHGLGIATVYKLGSQRMSFHPGLCVDRIEWIGVNSSDWNDIDSSYLCKMNSRDYTKADQLLKLDLLPESWKKELRRMKESGQKSEIQIILTDPRRKVGDHETPTYSRHTHNPFLFYLRKKIKRAGIASSYTPENSLMN